MKRALLILAIFIVLFLSKQYVPKEARLPQPELGDGGQATSSAISRVIRVVDGDTIEIEGGVRVRYIGIDSPEMEMCFAAEAKAENEKLVNDKTVRLEKDISETDKYNRLLRYVYIDNVMVNNLLVRQGFARAEPVKPDTRYAGQFLSAQDEAKANGRGLWSGCAH